jgi:hypothetical protein
MTEHFPCHVIKISDEAPLSPLAADHTPGGTRRKPRVCVKNKPGGGSDDTAGQCSLFLSRMSHVDAVPEFESFFGAIVTFILDGSIVNSPPLPFGTMRGLHQARANSTKIAHPILILKCYSQNLVATDCSI